MVKKCFFENNTGDYAGAIDSSNKNGTVVSYNNTFFSNSADKQSKLYGGGSVYKIFYGVWIISIENLYLSNFARRSGEKIINY